ncbi:MAG: hypothetical protein JO244_02195 [Solirubrobacterales bacterium]|nr:hypothetical protein [Solirubrobacterales bacterium]
MTSEAAGGQVADLVQAVLSDPNLHTDTRMRLHQEIPRLLQVAREKRSAPQ